MSNLVSDQSDLIGVRNGIVVIYDGDCPFCSNYVHLAALRDAVGSLELVDARSGDPRIRDIQKRGFDLNEGMIAIVGNKIYHGADAVVLLSTLGGNRGPFARLLSRVFRDPNRAHKLYPCLKMGRRLALRLLGRSQIHIP
jgi:predicted DCC family thiol-disulfide oxidoreductase YuxK